jgi:twitching motility protein PilT
MESSKLSVDNNARSTQLLRDALREGASDLHINPGYPPLVRVQGLITALRGYPVVQQQDPIDMVNEIATPAHRDRLQKDQSVDFTWGFEQNRFRTNIAMARTGLQICFRIIPIHIPSPEELLLQQRIIDLAELRHGLVLLTGTAGSGKSTTMACILNLINQRRAANIMTVEDPIEFVYPQRRSLVIQREIGPHTPSYESALRDALRQDPDVVMIGEMRDLETISAAITVAETGHVVYATLHSYDAPTAVDRMIDVFPARQQQQIRIQLAGVLKAVVAQNLIPARTGGRVAAREILMVTSAVSNLIRQSRTHEIPSAIEMGTQQGMISMDRSIQELVRTGLVDSGQANKMARTF